MKRCVRHLSVLLVGCLSVLSLLTTAAVAGAQIRITRTDDPSPAPMACTTEPLDCSLRGAVAVAATLPGAHAIVLPASTYTVAGPPIEIANGLSIIGAGAAVTEVSRTSGGRVFEIPMGAVVKLALVTVRSGVVLPDGDGGCIRNEGALTLERVAVRQCSARRGGGVWSGADTLRLIDSTVDSNEAMEAGGGIYSDGGSLTVTGSTISRNSAKTIATGGRGGGIYADGQVFVVNSTISTNTTMAIESGEGGGIFIGARPCLFAEFRNVTIAYNSAGTGGGISACNAAFANTVIAANIATLGPDCRFLESGGSRGFTLIGTIRDCRQYFRGTTDLVGEIPLPKGQIGTTPPIDPHLGPLAPNSAPTETHYPDESSPVLDAGSDATPGSDDAACRVRDQRGTARPVDSNSDGDARCDIGAVERHGPLLPEEIEVLLPEITGGLAFASDVELASEFERTAESLHMALQDTATPPQGLTRMTIIGPPPPFDPSMHSLSLAACCSFRAVLSQGMITQRFRADTAPGIPSVLIRVEVRANGRLEISRPCVGSCVPAPRVGFLHASASVALVAETEQPGSRTTLFQGEADLDILRFANGIFAPSGDWANAFVDAPLPPSPDVLRAAKQVNVMRAYDLEVPAGGILAVSTSLRTTAHASVEGVALADFFRSALIAVRISPADPNHDSITLVRVDGDNNPIPPVPVTPEDPDGDGVPSSIDNGPLVFNPDQADTDGDGVGDVGDNCMLTPNANQSDADGDGIGDVCDPTPLPIVSCAVDVTSELRLQRSAFRFNRATNRYRQTVTLTNLGNTVIAGPVSLALDGLTTGTTLVKQAGATRCAAPLGSPYVNVGIGTDRQLQPGESAQVVLEFSNSTNAAIAYTTRVLAGASAR
jgi:hypothetical protein